MNSDDEKPPIVKEAVVPICNPVESGNTGRRFFDLVIGRWDRAMPEIWTVDRVAEERRGIVSEIKRHRVVIALVLSMVVWFKSILVWMAFVAIWSFFEKVHALIPARLRLHLDRRIAPVFEPIRRTDIFDELDEAVAYTRPFFIRTFYLFCAPLTMLWVAAHWCRQVFVPDYEEREERARRQALTAGGGDVVVFAQNKRRQLRAAQNNFYYSPAFAITAFTIFAGGLPAAITFLLYRYLGIDAILGYPSQDPQFFWVIVIICFYFTSMAWCVCTLLFRAWFTFPLNFLGDEHELELDARRIRRRHYKGWLLSSVTMNSTVVGSSYINWDEVTTVNARNGIGTKFYPLPGGAFRGLPPVVEHVCNRIAMLYDSVAQRINRHQFISISTARDQYGWGREIDVNLADLSGEERARLFYAVRKWAPLAVVSQEAQVQMVGSCVMKEPKYTEIWFDLLTRKQDPGQSMRARTGALRPGDKLDGGTYEIVERIASGGQATAYLARCNSELCVLKEFILSDSEAVGALIQSASEFELEGSLLSQLDHPRIVKLHRCFSEDRRVYLALEHVEGKSLRRLVRESGALPADTVREIALQLCDVVSYLHGQSPPLVHRDLAPDNIMYEPDRGVKLIDFSLAAETTVPCASLEPSVSPLTKAQPTSRTTAGTGSASAVGKHAYTPPEQFREEATVQSDIYALGATMYFLLTGQDPKPLTRSNPALKNPEVPAALARIIEHATELEADKRYEDISWLKLDLENQKTAPPEDARL